MGRVELGMDDDGPGADDCKMPGFISSFEEGSARLSRSLSTQTSITDGKVARPVGHLRSDSRSSPDRGPGERSTSGGEEEEEEEGGKQEEEEEEEEEEERDAEGNNNNNCNGGGGAGRRVSAAEILRRNFGDLRSPSLRAHGSGRMQHDTRRGSVNADAGSDHGGERGECKTKSDGETVGAGAQNEPTPSESATSDVEGVVEYLKNVGKCDGEAGRDTPGESAGANEHIYCTVYCIANDGLLKEAEIPHRHHEAAASTTATDVVDSVSGRGAGSSPEPSLYTVDDLVDPFGDLSYRLFNELSGTEAAVRSCRVCLEETTTASLSCCRKAVCDECLKLYVSPQVRMGKVYISCPIPECNGNLEEGVVIAHLAKENVAKYQYFLELSQLDSSTKPCPHCSHFTSLKAQNPNRSEHKYKIQCSNCQFVWCFKCHAPWHNGIKCRDYRKGDKLLRTWASVIEDGQRNAQKCPQCKIHIQRTEGCDHMNCAQCNTNFCYRCGERYRHLRFFGDHTSNLSVFGCKYRYLPNKPHLRRLVRGSVCATKVLIAPVVILLVVVLGALALVIGLVVFPVYYVFKRRKKQHTRGSGRWI